MCWAVVLLICSVGVADDSIAYFEAGDARADLDDFPGSVKAEDKWVLERGKHHLAHVLDYPVNWVDSHCALRILRFSVPSR